MRSGACCTYLLCHLQRLPTTGTSSIGQRGVGNTVARRRLGAMPRLVPKSLKPAAQMMVVRGVQNTKRSKTLVSARLRFGIVQLRGFGACLCPTMSTSQASAPACNKGVSRGRALPVLLFHWSYASLVPLAVCPFICLLICPFVCLCPSLSIPIRLSPFTPVSIIFVALICFVAFRIDPSSLFVLTLHTVERNACRSDHDTNAGTVKR